MKIPLVLGVWQALGNPWGQLQGLADWTPPSTSGGPRNSMTAWPYPDIHDLGDLPKVDEDPDEDADLDHEVGLVVQDVEKDHERLEDAKEDGAHGQAFQGLPAVPELDVCVRELGRSREAEPSASCGSLRLHPPQAPEEVLGRPKGRGAHASRFHEKLLLLRCHLQRRIGRTSAVLMPDTPHGTVF